MYIKNALSICAKKFDAVSKIEIEDLSWRGYSVKIQWDSEVEKDEFVVFEAEYILTHTGEVFHISGEKYPFTEEKSQRLYECQCGEAQCYEWSDGTTDCSYFSKI